MMDRVIPTTLSPAEQRNLRDVTIRVDPVGTGFSILRTRHAWIPSPLSALSRNSRSPAVTKRSSTHRALFSHDARLEP
jgi:hypothetical protein